uniref:Nuclear receptor domain-containing protein n=1 Tax=Caenorhabditis tropicalis TaxID=1561998 RepID=A0A1I7UE24_9PELO
MFFRRRVVRTAPIKPCKYQESCYNVTPGPADCQFCRFYKCIQAGMTLQPLLQKSSDVIQYIAQLNANRKFKLLNCYPLEPCLTVSTVLSSDIQYSARPLNMDFHSWTYLSTVTCIEFMKQFPFVYFSKSADQLLIVNAYFIKIHSFCAAFQSYSNGKCSLPEGIFTGNTVLETRIRCRLVGKLIELKVADDEFLLMLVILFSNPAIPNLSPTARLLSSSYRHLYSSALFDYCMHTYQSFGPTRFTDLLGISSVLARHYEDVNQHFVLLQLQGADIGIHGIVTEGLDLL